MDTARFAPFKALAPLLLIIFHPVLVKAQTPLTLTPTPTSLTFNYVVGAATLPAALTVTVKANTGTPNYTTAVVGLNSLWLIATPDAGKMPASLSVRVNPTGMPVGTYTANVVVSATGSTATASVPVTLNVTSPLPTLALSTTTLAYTAPPLVPATQTVRLTTTGGPVSFTAAVSGGSWMTVTPSAGVVLPGAQQLLTVAVDATALTPQATPYTAKVTIVATGVAAANKTQNVTVSLTVNSPTPTITSVWPPQGVQVGSPATTVTIYGTGFYTSTVAKINGVTTPLSTTVFSATKLYAVIPAASLTTAATLNLLVSNPAPGGDSTTVPFPVTAAPSVQAVVSAASNGGAAISPGELVTLYGDNIGPVTAVGMADADLDGFADVTVGGVTVAIDGVNCPLIYASQDQISVQAPYEITIGTARVVTVTNGATISSGTVDVVAAAPALFSLDGSGTGQAAALNYITATSTYTVNQSAVPAKLGDIVVLYLTGEGDYAVAVSPRTGLLVPATLTPLPQLNPLPTVTIGGAAATVQYAGPMVGSILGLLQINATVPATATTGTAVPVSVTIGGVTTQAGMTLSIHQ